MKTDACYEIVEELAAQGEAIMSDDLIQLSSMKAQKDCPITLRRVTFTRLEDQKQLVFITNDLKRSAEDIAAL
ncbi:MAG: putative transposase [Gammaproteobacteria bacterium]|jgi:putative transposase